MVNNWQKAAIGDISEKVAMGPFGSSIKVETFVPQGIPVISGQHLRESRLRDGEYNFVSTEHANKLINANVKKGDVIFTHAGNIGQVAYIPESSQYERYVISQRQFYLRPNPKKAIASFITYFFKSPEGQHKLLANASSTGVPSITQPVTYLRTIELNLPPLPIQQKVSHILESLENKIDLNRQTNETLEAMAQAIFKSWFLESPKATLFTGSEPFTEIFEVNPSRPLRKNEIAPYLDMSNMPTQSARAIEVIDRQFGSGMRFINGDTLVARITPCLENGKTCYVDFLNEGQTGWGSTEYIVLRPKQPLPPEFGYFLARTDEFRAFAISNMTGTSGRQRVPADCLKHLKVSTPPPDLAKKFGRFASAVFAKMKSNDQESLTLKQLRNALLPKLISGEIKVNGAVN